MTTPFPEIGTTLDCYAGVDYMPTIHDCIRQTSLECGIPVKDITGRKMTREETRARQIAMWAARKMADKSFPQIARVFNRDHTTALHAYRLIEDMHNRNYGIYRVLARGVLCRLSRLRKNDPLLNI
jgi:chromosomal replication initiator protein